MEYVSAEEFLKQPIEFKKVFLDWWNPEKGDILAVKSPFVPNEYEMDCILEVKQNVITTICDFEYDDKQALIPLLTEGQLRKLLEDKIKGKIEYRRYNWDGWIEILLKDSIGYKTMREIRTEETEILKAYWKVICEIINK